jgi:putative nucleotidyltransferase with HDIG domain
MIAIPIEDLRSKSSAAVNLYLRLSDSKVVLWFKAGSNISPIALDKLVGKGVTELHVTADDFRAYVGTHISIASSIVGSEHTNAGSKLAVVEEASISVLHEIQSMGFNREVFMHAKLSTDVISTMAENHNQFGQFVMQMEQRAGSHVNHSVAVSMVATMISLKMGWSNPQVLEKIALGAFLHDVGMLKLPKDIQEKPVNKLSHNDLIVYQSHSELGRDMLRGLSFISDDVAAIVYQHHETSTGTGYPTGMKDMQLNPLAKVVALANEFCELAFKNPQQQQHLTAHDAIVQIELAMAQPFHKDSFAALKNLVTKEKKNA